MQCAKKYKKGEKRLRTTTIAIIAKMESNNYVYIGSYYYRNIGKINNLIAEKYFKFWVHQYHFRRMYSIDH